MSLQAWAGSTPTICQAPRTSFSICPLLYLIVPPRFEGDNYLLDLQVIRAAVKAYDRFSTTKDISELSPSTKYLRALTDTTPLPVATPSTTPLSAWTAVGPWADPQTAVRVLELRGAYVARDYAKHVGDADASAAQRVSKAVTEAFVAGQIGSYMGELRKQLPTREAGVIRDLLTLVCPSLIFQSVVS